MFEIIVFFMGLIALCILLVYVRKAMEEYKEDGYHANFPWFITYSTFLTGIFCVILFFTNWVMIDMGFRDYGKLEGMRAECLAVGSELGAVRQAYYINQQKSGKWIGGSLDNAQHSTNVTKYITWYAQYKAHYNSELIRIQTEMKQPIFNFFTSSFFRNKKILDMKPIP